MITIYYGMCGTFKLTTINTEKYKYHNKILSLIKPFQDLRTGIFQELSNCNDLTLANIRLLRLKQLKPRDCDYGVVIERGITDFLHCYNSRDYNNKLSNDFIKKIALEETKILKDIDVLGHKDIQHEIKKILLIMKDTEFIQNVILKEPHRLETYKNLENYLKCQEDYVDFTKKYNQLDEIIDIPNAQEYLKTLGLDYEED